MGAHPHHIPHRLVAHDAIGSVSTMLAEHMPARSLLLVCDDTTWVAAGEKLQAALGDVATSATHSLGRYQRATLSAAQELTAKATDYDGLVAIGSGTVNDVTKYAAAQANKPYICVPTAASMNGYTSITSSLEDNGVKDSFVATVPRAVIADTAVISAAPKRMTRAGLADTLCRSTVEADMLLSHWLLGTPYPRAAFDVMRAHDPDLIANATGAREGDPAFVKKLMAALLDAGDAMAASGSSAPASQGEHMIAHTLDLMYGAELRKMLHGELIALTTLTMNQLQHKMLLTQPIVKPMPRERAWYDRQFGKKNSQHLADHYAMKLLTSEQVDAINDRINEHWADIKLALIDIMTPPGTIQRAFVQSGLAIRPEEIGLGDERYRNACTYAYLTRERFGFLDLAAMNDKRVI